MKHYKKVVIPATKEATKLELEKTTCDLCGEVIKQEMFSEEKVYVQYKTGASCPEGGSGEITGVDMCSTCFNEKLTPWLKQQGCELHTVEWDW